MSSRNTRLFVVLEPIREILSNSLNTVRPDGLISDRVQIMQLNIRRSFTRYSHKSIILQLGQS